MASKFQEVQERFFKWADSIEDHLRHLREKADKPHLKPGVQRRRGTPSDYLVTLAANDTPTPVANKQFLCRDVVFDASPNNGGDVRIGGANISIAGELGHLLTPGSSYVYSIPATEDNRETWFDLADLYVTGSIGYKVSVQAVTYRVLAAS